MFSFIKSLFSKPPQQQPETDPLEHLTKTYPSLFNSANYKIHPDVNNAERMYQVEDHLEHIVTGDLFPLKPDYNTNWKTWWVSSLPLHIQYSLTKKEQECLEVFLVKTHKQLESEYKKQKRINETEKFHKLYSQG